MNCATLCLSPRTQFRLKHDRRRRGRTILEVLCVLVAIGILVVVAAGSIKLVKLPVSTVASMRKLQRISQAQACYAADWNDRQFTLVPDDFGEAADCADYIDRFGCLPSPILGWNQYEGGGSALWGYWIDTGGQCHGTGTCGNSNILKPMDFNNDSGFGSWRLQNVRGMREYLDGPTGFYRPDWYVPGEAIAPPKPFLVSDSEFQYDGEIFLSSYCSSPAAMFDPGVFRKASEGGFQDPSSYATSYRSPHVSASVYPDLKSRMTEHNWFRNAPTPFNPNAEDAETPWRFNQSMAAMPVTLFFDGSVDIMMTGQAFVDDLIVRNGTGGIDGLWSRDTPFGESGYFGEESNEGLFVSHHVLTTDGIRGRDLINR